MKSHFGRYRVLHKLGQGAMSAVFLSRDPVLSRLVAIKVMHPDLTLHRPLLDRFFREAKIAARIRSPHVVEVYDFGQEGRNPFLVMEFIDGLSVQKVLSQLDGRPLDPVVAAALICQAAEGLAVAAEAGVVHRDLKPDNLMLSENGYLKITDFGISHLAEHTMTRTGQVLGSPRFMSPEQVMGLKPISVQSDMFSLGSVLFYFLAGRTPFQAESVPELHKQITGAMHPSLLQLRPGTDAYLVRLVDTLLQKDPAKRGEGPGWLQLQLRTYLHKRSIIDPIEHVATYVRALASEGVQTTCSLDRDMIRQFMGSFELEKSPPRRGRVWKWIAVGLGALGMAAGGAALLPLLKNGTDEPVASAPTPATREEAAVRNDLQEPTVSKRLIWTAANQVPEPFPSMVKSPRQSPSRKFETVEAKQATAEDGDAVISIYSEPANASVSIDGYDYGRTPLESRFLPSGSYRIVLRSERGVEVDTLLAFPPGPHVHRFAFSGLGAPQK